MKTTTPPIPTGTCWIMARPALVQANGPMTLKITNGDASPFVETLSKRKLQVALTLKRSPVFCASPLRLRDTVMLLKRDHGLDIETTFHTEANGPEPATFGVYTLKSEIVEVELGGVAA